MAVKVAKKLVHLTEGGKKISKAKKKKKSIAWFKQKVGDSAKGYKKKAKLMPGKMFTFGYDAKYKAILPYWDKFPLIIVLDVYKDGFMGLNFHYLYPVERMKFLTKIMKFATQSGEVEDMTDRARFDMTWDVVRNIKNADKMLHKYLYGHVKTSLLEAPPKEWENAIFLPYQRFVGTSSPSSRAVWSK